MQYEGYSYVLAKAKGIHPIFLCTEPEFIELDDVSIAVFPYPRKAGFVGTPEENKLSEAFVGRLQEFNQRFSARPGCFRLFFGHFGVAGARVSSGQPLVGRCAEYPLDPAAWRAGAIRGAQSHSPPAATGPPRLVRGIVVSV